MKILPTRVGISLVRKGTHVSHLVIRKNASAASVTLTLDATRETLDVDIEQDAQASLFLILQGKKSAEHTLQIKLAKRSRLTLVLLSPSSPIPQKILQSIFVASEASLALTCVTFASSITHELTSRVEGRGGESVIRWIAYARDGEKQDLTLASHFHAKAGRGSVAMRGVAEGRSMLTCRGKVEIGKGAERTQATLSQNLLMLDAKARVEAIPALEVHTNDVRASHAASVTKINENDLFYLSSRGLPREEARALCIDGFLDEFLASVTDPTMRRSLEKALTAKKRRKA